VLQQRRQALLAGRQSIAVEYAHLPARQDRAAIHGRGHWRQVLGTATHQGAQEAGSVRSTLSYSAASVTGSVAIVRAAACSDGRRPRDTSITSSTTVKNNNSREYWRSRCSSNTSSIHPADNACSSAVRAITLAGACCSNRSTTEVQMMPLLLTRQI